MKRFTASLILLAMLAAITSLSGCTDKHITEVKASRFRYNSQYRNDPNMTVDQVLDHRKICDSVKWTVNKTDRGQTMVEYNCKYKGIADSMFIKDPAYIGPDKGDGAYAGDVYQWIYGADGQPVLTGVSFILRYKDGSTKNISNNFNVMDVMLIATADRAQRFDQVYSYFIRAPIPVKPAMPFTDTTYGNTLTAYYPGHSAAEAASLAYQWKRTPLEGNGGVRGGYVDIDAAGYPGVFYDGSVDQLFPVNPADVQFAKKVDERIQEDISEDLSSVESQRLAKLLPLAPNKLFCLNNRCYDRGGELIVGRAPKSVLAQETELNKWVQISVHGTTVTSTSMAPPAQETTPVQSQAVPAPKPIPAGLTPNTYGNEVGKFFPKDQDNPQMAAQEALDAIPGSNLNIDNVNQQGYPTYGMECEGDGHCINNGGLNLGSEADAAKMMFPVNPADIGRFGIMCDQYLCRDSQGNVIGRKPN